MGLRPSLRCSVDHAPAGGADGSCAGKAAGLVGQLKVNFENPKPLFED